MVDIDNFKQINDNYGHATGDEILFNFADRLISCLGEKGIVGRFGGDEFLFVDLVDLNYDDKHKFCSEMYSNNTIRTNYKLKNYQPFITATAGMVSYPEDANSYIELFAKLDKVLYRGKSKGRNCFIIYVEEKHKDIEMIKLKKKAIYTVFKDIANSFEINDDIYGKMYRVTKELENDLNISDFYYINKKFEIKSFTDRKVKGYLPEIDLIVKEAIYSTNNLEDLIEYPVTYNTLVDNEIETLMIVKVSVGSNNIGYLMCAESHNLRIWQENEFAILFLVAKILAGYMTDRNLNFD